MLGFERNRVPFSEICSNAYGRQIIYTGAKVIDKSNIVKEIGKAYSIHLRNRTEIDYLERYYKGDQPILYRQKTVRPEINNKIVENHALEIVEHKAAENFGEPVQYVLKSVEEATKEQKSKELNDLNDYNELEAKDEIDINMARDRSICGTSYRFHYSRKNPGPDEAPYGIEREDPKDTFIVYSTDNGHKPMFSCQIRKDENGNQFFFAYTPRFWFKVQNGKIVGSGVNGHKAIPVIEYPNNFYRLSDIEIVITVLDAINTMQSDRMNGIEQFVQSFIKFLNCEIDEKQFREMRQSGALKIKSNGSMKADAEIMSDELDQQQTQTAKDDLYENMLIVEGMPDRQENSGGDTGQAVVMRNGFYFSEKRAELSEPIYKKSERESIKVILNILRIKGLTSLILKDIEIKITRSKMDNMQVKAQVFQLLTASGIDPKVAIKVCNLFSDPEEVYLQSKPYLDAKYPVSGEEVSSEDNENKTDLSEVQ
ncbi:MAG: phage portal protein [Roseburia sp.]|nr:phage portal protein [Roseburia sp.]